MKTASENRFTHAAQFVRPLSEAPVSEPNETSDAQHLASLFELMLADFRGIASDTKQLVIHEFRLSLRCIVLAFLFALASVVLITLAWIGLFIAISIGLSALDIELWKQVVGITLLHLALVYWAWNCAKTFYDNIGFSRSITLLSNLFDSNAAHAAEHAKTRENAASPGRNTP